jgi:hypothetical protein
MEMKKIIVAIVAALYATITFPMPAEQWMIGKWKVIKIQGYSPPPFAYPEPFVGKYLVIKKESMEINGKKSILKIIKVTKENTFKSFEEGYLWIHRS